MEEKTREQQDSIAGQLSQVEYIKTRLSQMSKGQKAIGEFIIYHYEEAAYMTAAKIGLTVGVSESTVVRFSMELGYDGYPHFQKLLQEELKVKLTSVQRLQASQRFQSEDELLTSIIQGDIDNLKSTFDTIDRIAFQKAVHSILLSKRIFIIGLRSSAPLASFMSFYFSLLFDNVKQIHSNSANEIFEQILPINKDDILIGIGFPRYSLGTIQAMQYAKSKEAKVLAITDKAFNPLALNSDISLLVKSDMASFVDSLVAPLSLINAFIVALGAKKREHLKSTFETLENLWDEYEIYDKGQKSWLDY